MPDSHRPDKTTFRCGRCKATIEHQCPAGLGHTAAELRDVATEIAEALGNLDPRTAGRLGAQAKRLEHLADALAAPVEAPADGDT